ncbi:MAG: formimidoylglutamase [Vibrio casei]|uniref:formimidoylglutamase n=1 Tax=Vibrio casei TaxID=673372 RepID=UPI003F98DBFB
MSNQVLSSNYQEKREFQWAGRIDPEANSLRWHQVIKPVISAAENGYALIGFCCDLGVSQNKGRIGAALAPNSIRQALANLSYIQKKPLYDAGNVHCLANQLDQAQAELGNQVQTHLESGHFPIILGGGHEVAYGSWLGFSQYLQAQHSKIAPKVGIINFDAHFDLRDSSHVHSSGTPFHQIAYQSKALNWPFHYACLGVSQASNTQALFNTADSLGVLAIQDHLMTTHNLFQIMTQITEFIDQCDHIYLTVDMDVFPSSQAPGVSAPAACGVGIEIIEPLLRHIKATQKLRLFDIAELNPNFDRDHQTARLAARLIHTLTL